MSPQPDHKPITETDLDQWDAMCHCSECGNDTETPMRQLIAEVRRLRAEREGLKGYVEDAYVGASDADAPKFRYLLRWLSGDVR